MTMHTTPRTCRQCKTSKKKCDRAKPICARCSRLSLPCAFDGDIESSSADIATKFEKVFERLEKLESQGCDPGKQQRASANTTITHDTNTIKWQLSPGLFQPSYLEVIASANVSHVLEKKNITMLDVAGKHLGTLCSFLPIIPQERFSNRLHEAQELKPHGSFSILSLAIVLLTEDSISHPGGPPSSLKPVSEAYQVCKYHYSLLCSLNDPSIELIQAGLCIALYEHLQVIGDQEYLTIGGCARMASLLRLSPYAAYSPQGTDTDMCEEENMPLIWGIYTIDKHISIMSEMASRHLPWEFSPISEPFDITDLGHFQAEAEATHILYSLRKILHRDKPKELNETQITQVTALGQRLEYLRAKVQNSHASHTAWRSELATILVALLLKHSYFYAQERRLSSRIDPGEWSEKLFECTERLTEMAIKELSFITSSGHTPAFISPFIITTLALITKTMDSLDLTSVDNYHWTREREIFVKLLQCLGTKWIRAKTLLETM